MESWRVEVAVFSEMPVSSDFIHDKYAAVSPEKLVTCVTGMSSTTKGYGFGSQRSLRFPEEKRMPGISKSSSSLSLNTTPATSPMSKSGSSLPLEVSKSAVNLYGSERSTEDLIGPAEMSRSNPAASQWVASMGSQGMPRPYTSQELSIRRKINSGAR